MRKIVMPSSDRGKALILVGILGVGIVHNRVGLALLVIVLAVWAGVTFVNRQNRV